MSGVVEEEVEEFFSSRGGGDLDSSHDNEFVSVLFFWIASSFRFSPPRNDVEQKRSHSGESVSVSGRVFFRQDFTSSENEGIGFSEIAEFF